MKLLKSIKSANYITTNNSTDIGQLVSKFELVFEYKYSISQNVNKSYTYT